MGNAATGTDSVSSATGLDGVRRRASGRNPFKDRSEPYAPLGPVERSELVDPCGLQAQVTMGRNRGRPLFSAVLTEAA